jgi:spore maturation protein SpmB
MLSNPLIKVLNGDTEVVVRVLHDSISMTDARKVAFHYIHHHQPTEQELRAETWSAIIRDVPSDVVAYIRSLP